MEDPGGRRSEDDGVPQPRMLWRPAARVGTAVTAVLATVVELWSRVARRDPRQSTDIEQARRARAARLLTRRMRDDGRR